VSSTEKMKNCGGKKGGKNEIIRYRHVSMTETDRET